MTTYPWDIWSPDGFALEDTQKTDLCFIFQEVIKLPYLLKTILNEGETLLTLAKKIYQDVCNDVLEDLVVKNGTSVIS